MNVRSLMLDRAMRLNQSDYVLYVLKSIIDENDRNGKYHSLRLYLPIAKLYRTKIRLLKKLRRLNRCLMNLEVTVDDACGIINICWEDSSNWGRMYGRVV